MCDQNMGWSDTMTMSDQVFRIILTTGFATVVIVSFACQSTLSTQTTVVIYIFRACFSTSSLFRGPD